MVSALAFLFDRQSWFLLGAAGGLVSRLTQILKRRPTAKDYGADWSSIILSPATGALTGWIGVAIIVVLAQDPVKLLDAKFAAPWDNATLPLGLLVAFLCGFSARFFTKLVDSGISAIGGAFPTPQAEPAPPAQ